MNEIEDNTSIYRQAYESAMYEEEDARNERQGAGVRSHKEEQYYKKYGDAILGEKALDKIKDIEETFTDAELKESEQTVKKSLSSIASELRRLGANESTSRAEIEYSLDKISGEIKKLKETITKNEKESAKKEAQKRLEQKEKQKARYENIIEALKEKQRYEKLQRAIKKEQNKVIKNLAYNEKTMDADTELGLLYVKQAVYDYEGDEGKLNKDIWQIQNIETRRGKVGMPVELQYLLQEYGVDLNNISSLIDLKNLNKALQDYRKYGRAVYTNKVMARREALFNVKLAGYNNITNDNLRLNFNG